MNENAGQTDETGPGLDFILRRAHSALVRYQAEYDRLTDLSKVVQCLNRLMGKLSNKDGISAKILRQQIREAREKHRPDLPTPLSLADGFVRAAVQVLGATDFEKELGERIVALELSLRRAQDPKNLHEHMLRLLEEGVNKNTVGNVLVSFFNGVREGKNVCCPKEPSALLLDRLDDVTSLTCVDDGEGAPCLAVLTSPDSPRLAGDTTPVVVFPMARLLEGLRKYDVLAGIVLDPWDRGGLVLKRDALLRAWDRNEQFHQEQQKKS